MNKLKTKYNDLAQSKPESFLPESMKKEYKMLIKKKSIQIELYN